MQIQFDTGYARSTQFDIVAEDDNRDRESIQLATRFMTLALMVGDLSPGAQTKTLPAGVPTWA